MFTWGGDDDEKTQRAAYIAGGDLADSELKVEFALVKAIGAGAFGGR